MWNPLEPDLSMEWSRKTCFGLWLCVVRVYGLLFCYTRACGDAIVLCARMRFCQCVVRTHAGVISCNLRIFAIGTYAVSSPEFSNSWSVSLMIRWFRRASAKWSSGWCPAQILEEHIFLSLVSAKLNTSIINEKASSKGQHAQKETQWAILFETRVSPVA